MGAALVPVLLSMAAETSSVTGVEVKLVDALGKETVVSEGEHTLGRGPLLKVFVLAEQRLYL